MFHIRPAHLREREQIMALIDQVAGERRYLQTDRYRPTPQWETVLHTGRRAESGLSLLVVMDDWQIVGVARLFPDERFDKVTGNVGLVLLPAYRSRRLGTVLLGRLLLEASRLSYRSLTADILCSNERSLRLFARYRFRVAGYQYIDVSYRATEVAEVTVRRDISVAGEVFDGFSDCKPQ